MVKINIKRDLNGPIYAADNGSTITVTNFSSNLDEFTTELNKLSLHGDENNKKDIEEALEAIEQNDENKFIKALKKLGSFISSVASEFTAGILLEYMKQKGLML